MPIVIMADDSWPKTTGGKGLHVVAPLDRKLTHDPAHAYAKDRFGLFAAYARTIGDVRGHALGDPNSIAGRAELDGTSFGAYWTHLTPTGWYINAVLMGTRSDGGGHTVVGTDVDLKGYGVTASLEGGYPIARGSGLGSSRRRSCLQPHQRRRDRNHPRQQGSRAHGASGSDR